jgi:hypothetical protein
MEKSADWADLVLLLIASSSAPSLSSLILVASSLVGFCRSEIGEVSVVGVVGVPLRQWVVVLPLRQERVFAPLRRVGE